MAEKSARYWNHLRLAVVLLGLAVFMGAVVHRAYSLMLLDNERFRRRAADQQMNEVKIFGRRGTLIDRDGRVLAVSLEVDSVFAQPKLIRDPAGAAGQLAPILRLEAAELERRLRKGKYFAWVKRLIPEEEAARIRALNLPGIGLTKESKRYYPLGSQLAHTLGYVGVDGPLAGLELSQNRYLEGPEIYLTRLRDATGKPVYENGFLPAAAIEGLTLRLTIDSTVQYIAERELARGVVESKAQAGMIVVQDTATGDLLAVASYPAFDPNQYQAAGPAALRNRPVQDAFEPGSTFKVFVMGAALDEGVVRPDEVFDCENGSFRVANRVIHDVHPHARLTAAELIQVSSNIGMAKVGLRLGKQRLYDRLKAYGLGQKTELGLPGERRGVLIGPANLSEVGLATLSFGQGGILVTAVQLAAGFTMVARGGDYVAPRLLDSIVDASGETVKKVPGNSLGQVMKPETAAQLTQMLVAVTSRGGTGERAQVAGFQAGGKTGTAQKVDSASKAYSATKFVSSFTGFIPAQKPRLTIVVVLDEPSGVTYGGLVAAPVFARVAEETLKHLGVTPPQLPEIGPGETPLAPPKLPPREQPAAEGVLVESNPSREAAGADQIPEVTGLTLRQALTHAAVRGLSVSPEGSGVVVRQAPPAGASLPQDRILRLWLKPLAAVEVAQGGITP